MRIQHNIMAMNAYRNYTNNTSALSKNLEKLSSGYKINRAGDDAAGLAISEKMRAQITGLSTAQKNAKDGISLIQTAEGALTEVHDMLNRMVELADQSANGTYDNDVDRANLQKEFEALRDEIDRIAEASNFNGIKLLDGSLSTKAVAGEVIDLSSALPEVGNVLGENTVLKQDATSAAKGQFSVDLGNVQFNGASADATSGTNADVMKITLSSDAGSLTLSIDGNGKPMTAGDIAKAFESKYGTGGASASDVEIDGQAFTVAASGNTLVFTQKAEPTNKDEVVDTSLSVKLSYQVGGTGPETPLKQRDRIIQNDLVYDNMRTSKPSSITGANSWTNMAVTTDVTAELSLATGDGGSTVLTEKLSGVTPAIGGGDISISYNTGNDKFEMFVGNTLVAESATLTTVGGSGANDGKTTLDFKMVTGADTNTVVASITFTNAGAEKNEAALATALAGLASDTGLEYVNGTGATQAVASGTPVSAALKSGDGNKVDFSGLDLKAIATALGTAAGGDLTLSMVGESGAEKLALFVGGTQIGSVAWAESLSGGDAALELTSASGGSLGTIALTKGGSTDIAKTDFANPIATGISVTGANDGTYESLASVSGTAADAAAIAGSDLTVDFSNLLKGNLANAIDSLAQGNTAAAGKISINMVSVDGGVQVQLKSGNELLATSETIASVGGSSSVDIAFKTEGGMSLGSIKLSNSNGSNVETAALQAIAEGENNVVDSGLTFNAAVKVEGGGDTPAPSGDTVIQVTGELASEVAFASTGAVTLKTDFTGLNTTAINNVLKDMGSAMSDTGDLKLAFNASGDGRLELKIGDTVVGIGVKDDKSRAATFDVADGDTYTFYALGADGNADMDKPLGSVTMKVDGDASINLKDATVTPASSGASGAPVIVPPADDPVSNKVLSGDYNVGTTVIQSSQTQGDSRLASTKFTLTSDMVQDGAKLKIGDQTFVFAVGDKSTVAAGSGEVLVDLKDLATMDLSEAAKRITEKAAGNKVFSVGHNGAEITVTEKPGQEEAKNLDTLEGIEAQLGATSAGKAGGKGLTLQIGEDSKSHNQLTVSVSDMHAKALGLSNISIGKQGDAALAVDVIKQAINSVSSTRGDLGAMQNRLEHTINNLSVMTENIQDAEATIRDVDVAEEMMAYTKNNILVQSAQAMLAQANQLPQGVLQLLQ